MPLISKPNARKLIREEISNNMLVKMILVPDAQSMSKDAFINKYIGQWGMVKDKIGRPELGKLDAKIILSEGYDMIKEGLA